MPTRSAGRVRGSTSQILLDDPELAARLSGERLALATRDCIARTVRLRGGVWRPTADVAHIDHGIGLLLEGLMVRRVGIAGRFGAELLGEGDLLRPWQAEDAGGTLPRTGRWRALQPCRVAILDRGFAARMAPYPEVISELFGRAIRRSRHTVVAMAIVHQPRVDVRLQMLFWELADRWGRVHADGVHLPLALTHSILADLVAARRPTVSKALGELAHEGKILWTGEAWRLTGEQPGELGEVGAVSISPSG